MTRIDRSPSSTSSASPTTYVTPSSPADARAQVDLGRVEVDARDAGHARGAQPAHEQTFAAAHVQRAARVRGVPQRERVVVRVVVPAVVAHGRTVADQRPRACPCGQGARIRSTPFGTGRRTAPSAVSRLPSATSCLVSEGRKALDVARRTAQRDLALVVADLDQRDQGAGDDACRALALRLEQACQSRCGTALGDEDDARATEPAEHHVLGARVGVDGLLGERPAAADRAERGTRRPGWPAIQV